MLMVRALDAGGTERQVAQIARSLDRERFTPHVGCFEATGFRAEELRAAGVPILQMRMRSFLSADSAHVLLAMRRYLGKHGIQLVHTFDYPMNVFCAPAARMLGTRVVLSSQRSYRDLIPAKYLPVLRISDRLVDGIVVNCEAIRAHLVERFSVPNTKIATCYNAIDTSVFRPGPRTGPPEVRNAALVVGVVCILRDVKDLKTLVSAFARVAAGRKDLALLLVGDGPEKEPLRRQVSELGIALQVAFVPATPDVAAWMRAIDVFVLPSISEALSNSLMEAMASGCCAIASRVGGNPELVEDGVTGLLFEPGDADGLARQLSRVLGDESLRLRMAAAGAARIAKEFSRERSMRRLEEVYSEKLRHKGVSVPPK
jgi:glycosyltransferase involved in cell wall biosynthesis